ncbi:hypothetical protein, partial [Acinetobacter baumannii]
CFGLVAVSFAVFCIVFGLFAVLQQSSVIVDSVVCLFLWIFALLLARLVLRFPLDLRRRAVEFVSGSSVVLGVGV